MLKRPLIQRSANVLGGTPVFAGTRVPVRIFFDYLKAGKSVHDFSEDFPSVSKKQALLVLEKIKQNFTKRKHEATA